DFSQHRQTFLGAVLFIASEEDDMFPPGLAGGFKADPILRRLYLARQKEPHTRKCGNNERSSFLHLDNTVLRRFGTGPPSRENCCAMARCRRAGRNPESGTKLQFSGADVHCFHDGAVRRGKARRTDPGGNVSIRNRSDSEGRVFKGIYTRYMKGMRSAGQGARWIGSLCLPTMPGAPRAVQEICWMRLAPWRRLWKIFYP